MSRSCPASALVPDTTTTSTPSQLSAGCARPQGLAMVLSSATTSRALPAARAEPTARASASGSTARISGLVKVSTNSSRVSGRNAAASPA